MIWRPLKPGVISRQWVRVVGSANPWDLSPWFMVLYVLAALQTGHLVEHIVQMWQLHVLQMSALDARGIVSVLDEEPVHFVFNLGVFAGVAVLRRPFPRNPWLAVCLPLTAWHALEHCFLLWAYLHGEMGAGILG
ncbi:MAG: hypothetical protein M3069_19145, partial [Chloroflexota bacterium]|nr:hypothetical protein [Chloroflexota bacterium]